MECTAEVTLTSGGGPDEARPVDESAALQSAGLTWFAIVNSSMRPT